VAGGSTEVIEKDYHLHRLLGRISEDDYLAERLVFKGGTCLVKAYAGYFRFSEDVDFAWRDQDMWEGRTTADVKRECSAQTEEIVKRVREISRDLGYVFRGDGKDRNEVRRSSGGRMLDMYPAYSSTVLGTRSRIKIEVNFVDVFLFDFMTRELRSYVGTFDDEEVGAANLDRLADYRRRIALACYDPREIFVEKCRAALTRKAYKARDVLDICQMEEIFGYSVPQFESEIRLKTAFMLDTYERYGENLAMNSFPRACVLSDVEERLMLGPLPGRLQGRAPVIHSQLDRIRKGLARTSA